MSFNRLTTCFEMLPYLKDKFGNPSSSHPYGVALKAGIEQAREQALMDLHLAGQNGFDVLDAIRQGERGRHVRVIMISGPSRLTFWSGGRDQRMSGAPSVVS